MKQKHQINKLVTLLYSILFIYNTVSSCKCSCTYLFTVHVCVHVHVLENIRVFAKTNLCLFVNMLKYMSCSWTCSCTVFVHLFQSTYMYVMYIFQSMWMHRFVNVFMFIYCTCQWTLSCIYTCTCSCTFMCMYIMFVYMCMFIFMYIMFVCMFIYLFVNKNILAHVDFLLIFMKIWQKEWDEIRIFANFNLVSFKEANFIYYFFHYWSTKTCLCALSLLKIVFSNFVNNHVHEL